MTEASSVESSDEEFERAAKILLEARHTIGLSGAGLSVESGIPVFRGPGGIWTRYGEPPMDGFQRFLRDPAGAWRERLHPEGPMKGFAETLRRARPNGAHDALVQLEEWGLLRCLITQNIDNLHRAAGHRNLIEIHGNATLLRCLDCTRRWPREAIEVDPENLPPRCEECGGIIKSDTVQFGEPIPEDLLPRIAEEGARADCCIVAGTSATVMPAAQIPLDVRGRGGLLIEINLYETEISPLCAVTLRGPGAATLTRLAASVRPSS